MSADYYKKYMRGLKNKRYASESKTAFSSTAFSSVFSILLPSNRKVGCEAENSESSKMRSIKSVIKEHQNIIDNFIISKSDIISRSKEAYKQIWEDFLWFSGSINHNAVSKYIWWKFQLDINRKDKKITLNGTALKYELRLSQFFNYVELSCIDSLNLRIIKINYLILLLIYFQYL